MTAAKMEMVQNATPPQTRWALEQFAAGGAFAGRELIAARELIQHAREAFDSPQGPVRDKHAVTALKRAGYRTIELKVKTADGQATRLWTNSGRPDMLAQLGHAGLLSRYEASAAGSDAKRKGA